MKTNYKKEEQFFNKLQKLMLDYNVDAVKYCNNIYDINFKESITKEELGKGKINNTQHKEPQTIFQNGILIYKGKNYPFSISGNINVNFKFPDEIKNEVDKIMMKHTKSNLHHNLYQIISTKFLHQLNFSFVFNVDYFEDFINNNSIQEQGENING